MRIRGVEVEAAKEQPVEEEAAKKQPVEVKAAKAQAPTDMFGNPVEVDAKEPVEEPAEGFEASSACPAAEGSTDSTASPVITDCKSALECRTSLITEDVWAIMAAMGAHLASGRRVSQMSAK